MYISATFCCKSAINISNIQPDILIFFTQRIWYVMFSQLWR